MENIFDYLEWRGDLTFAQSPFNEVDNLILSKLAFINYNGIVPAPDQNRSISLKNVIELYTQKHGKSGTYFGALIPVAIFTLFKKASASKRFENIELSAFVDIVDTEQEMQMSAYTANLGDNTKFIAFRGTDDTIIGWKENFKMSFCECVPAQKAALEYLHGIALAGPEMLRIGGHSKGGNLAVYAAMHSIPEIQARILEVYSNDGPGFKQSILSIPGYLNIRSKVKAIVPQSTIVGILLEHEDNFEVIKSTGRGVLQHDGFTWDVKGTGFIRVNDRTKSCRNLDITLREWVNKMTLDERKKFSEAIFELLEASGAKTITDLSTDRIKKISAMLTAMRKYDKETREMLMKAITFLIKESATPKKELAESKQKNALPAAKKDKTKTADESEKVAGKKYKFDSGLKKHLK